MTNYWAIIISDQFYCIYYLISSDHKECVEDSCGPLAECTSSGGCVCVAGYEIPSSYKPTPESYGCVGKYSFCIWPIANQSWDKLSISHTIKIQFNNYFPVQRPLHLSVHFFQCQVQLFFELKVSDFFILMS